MSTKSKHHLFQALIKPHLTYAPMALLSTAQTNKDKLQIRQNKALRWVHNVRWDDFISNHTIHQRNKTPELKTVWAQQLTKQLTKMNNWCSDWIEKIEQLSNTGIRSGYSYNYLTHDYLELDD